MNFAILLPSAEGKKSGGNPLAPDMFDYRTSNTFNYFSELNPERRALINALQAAIESAPSDELETVFGVKGDALEEALKTNRNAFSSPLMAAIDRYGPGVLYRSMEFSALATGAQRRLLENGIIFSGLFGLLRPDDLVPDYKLRMDAKLEGVGKVSHYWRSHISPLLAETLKDKFVWDLLPAAHRDAWVDEEPYAGRVEVKFFRDVDGDRKPVTHGVKELRGALVHYIVSEMANSAEALEDWEAPEGFEMDARTSELPTSSNKSGTLVLVQYQDWERRAENRRLAREAAAAERARPADDDETDED
ncbi:YaaA family protein [soil metagenome]